MRDLGLDPYTRALLVDKHNPYSLVNKLRYQVRGKKMNRNIRERLEGDNLIVLVKSLTSGSDDRLSGSDDRLSNWSR